MHELNVNVRGAADDEAVRRRGRRAGRRTTGRVALLAVDHGVDEHAAAVRRDQRVRDRYAVEVAEGEP